MTVDPAAVAGGPRLFAVAATALPLPVPDGLRSIGQPTEVALRTPPPVDEVFPIRAPRGVFTPGAVFGLRCAGPYGAEAALVRVLSVSDGPTVNIQLVLGRVVRPAEGAGEQQAAPARASEAITAKVIDGEVEGAAFGASLLEVSDAVLTFAARVDLDVETMLQIVDAEKPGLRGAVLRILRADKASSSTTYTARFEHAGQGRGVEAVPAAPRRAVGVPGAPAAAGAGRGAPSLAASASRVEVDGVPTIAAETSVTLHTPVERGAVLQFTAPRGLFEPGVCFILRYFDGAAAARGLVRATAVRPQPGMSDAVEGVLLRDSVPAPQAASYRVRIDRFFTAEVLNEGGRAVTGRLLDLSAGGVGFQAGGALQVGDRLRFRPSEATLPGLGHVEVVVVRRDPRDPKRFGARFVEAGRGERALATILDADRAERERLRGAKKEAERRGREISAAAALEALGASARSGGEAADAGHAQQPAA